MGPPTLLLPVLFELIFLTVVPTRPPHTFLPKLRPTCCIMIRSAPFFFNFLFDLLLNFLLNFLHNFLLNSLLNFLLNFLFNRYRFPSRHKTDLDSLLPLSTARLTTKRSRMICYTSTLGLQYPGVSLILTLVDVHVEFSNSFPVENAPTFVNNIASTVFPLTLSRSASCLLALAL